MSRYAFVSVTANCCLDLLMSWQQHRECEVEFKLLPITVDLVLTTEEVHVLPSSSLGIAARLVQAGIWATWTVAPPLVLWQLWRITVDEGATVNVITS